MEIEICKNCCKYLEKKDEFINSYDSVYEAVAEMWFFIKECSKICILKNRNK